MSEWTGIIGTLAGVASGGLITWLLSKDQRVHESKKEKRQLLLSKYEEIHKLLGKLHGGANQLNFQIIAETVSDYKFDPKQIRTEMSISDLRMLIQFYVPELTEKFGYLDKQIEYLYESVVKFIANENKTREIKIEAALNAQETNKTIHNTINEMKSVLARLASAQLESA